MKKMKVAGLCLSSMLFFACASSTPDNSAEIARNRANAGYSDLNREVGNSPYAASASIEKQQVSATSSQYADIQKPVIMVMPAPDSAGLGGGYVLSHNANSRVALETVNEYLTGRSYEVRSLEGQNELDEAVQMMNEISGSSDVSYAASLLVGADIYIKYSGNYDIREKMMNVELTAYEASTARLLGSQVSHLKNNDTRKESLSYLIHDAVNKAMPGLENKILSYWAEDLQKGSQYKVVMKISENYAGGDLEDIQDKVVSSLRSRFSGLRVNAMSNRTIDIILYVDSKKFQDAYAVYSEIRQVVSSVATAKKNNISKKLITLDIQ